MTSLVVINLVVNMFANAIWPVGGDNPLKWLIKISTGFVLGMFATAYYASKTS